MDILERIFTQYRFFEFSTRNTGTLPSSPTDREKTLYLKRNNWILAIFSTISFVTLGLSMYGFLTQNIYLWSFVLYFIFTVIYFIVSSIVNNFSKDFDFKKHQKITHKCRNNLRQRVDIFLPTAGEPIEVLNNTWEGVRALQNHHKGVVTVYCLDDSGRQEVRSLARYYNFTYVVRPKRRWFKKAGNLRYGYKISNGEFITVFDADFRPRVDFFDELLPYFDECKSIGLVQTPQFFDVSQNQNWLQRGAGSVQELFYRLSQVSRQSYAASICVGTNAIYRRTALSDTGGTALIHHSEDVHTGFNMRMKGWDVNYVPLILAKGLCPSDMQGFFNQQYRWCLGSMSLLTSKKFWTTKMSFLARLSYISGFLHYMHTGISSLVVPLIPLIILLFFPQDVKLSNALLLLPSILFVQIIYPFWHKSTYGVEAWSTRSIYGWAHLIAIGDGLLKRSMTWRPTGAKATKDTRYTIFRLSQVMFNFLPASLWVYVSADYVLKRQDLSFLPLLISGLYYYFITAKVTFYKAEEKLPMYVKPSFFEQIRVGVVRSVPVIAFLLILIGSLYVYTPPRISLHEKNLQKHIHQSSTMTRYTLSEIPVFSASPSAVLGVSNTQLSDSWEYYKKHFVTKSGQSLDPDRQYETTSEGQAYLMLRSSFMGDKAMFDRSWMWTKEHLQHESISGDILFSWLYGSDGGKEKVISTDNATDADEDIALALIIAGYTWHNTEYLEEAQKIIASLFETNVVEVKERYYLIAGTHFKKENGYVINPSHLSPASYRIFAKFDQGHDWEKVATDSYYLLNQITRSTPESVGLPPNWIFLSRSGQMSDATAYAGTASHIYGYDAFRTYFRVALDEKWFQTKEAKEYLEVSRPFFTSEWDEKEQFAAIYALSGQVKVASSSTSMAVGPLSVFTSSDKEETGTEVYIKLFAKIYRKEGYWGDGSVYYDQNWAWFGTALFTDSLRLPVHLEQALGKVAIVSDEKD